MNGFFAMGGYAAFVWPCYAVTIGAMLWLGWTSWRKASKNARKLAALGQQDGA
jgi:heme exporter protein D